MKRIRHTANDAEDVEEFLPRQPRTEQILPRKEDFPPHKMRKIDDEDLMSKNPEELLKVKVEKPQTTTTTTALDLDDEDYVPMRTLELEEPLPSLRDMIFQQSQRMDEELNNDEVIEVEDEDIFVDDEISTSKNEEKEQTDMEYYFIFIFAAFLLCVAAADSI